MGRLLASSDLCNAPEVWLPKMASAARLRRDLHELPELVRDVGFVLGLDAEVRIGGFAQYFFNPPCRYVFDTWFALDALDATCVGLLSSALLRVGASYGFDLDVRKLAAQDDDALAPAYGRLIDAVSSAREQSGTLQERFARFRDRLAEDHDGHEGLDSLNKKWCAYEAWKDPIVERILTHRFEFTAV